MPCLVGNAFFSIKAIIKNHKVTDNKLTPSCQKKQCLYTLDCGIMVKIDREIISDIDSDTYHARRKWGIIGGNRNG